MSEYGFRGDDGRIVRAGKDTHSRTRWVVTIESGEGGSVDAADPKAGKTVGAAAAWAGKHPGWGFRVDWDARRSLRRAMGGTTYSSRKARGSGEVAYTAIDGPSSQFDRNDNATVLLPFEL